jgi:toxin YoeB
MGKYKLLFSEEADAELDELKKSRPNLHKKAKKLLEEIEEHPETGTGKPEKLKYDLAGFMSRRLSLENRLMYIVDEENRSVYIYSFLGHYEK